MTSTMRTAFYMTAASIAVIGFTVAKAFVIDGTSGDNLLYVAATAALLNVFPMMFGSHLGMKYRGKRKPLAGALWTGALWLVLLFNMGLSKQDYSTPVSYLPTAVFSAVATAFIMWVTLNGSMSSSSDNDVEKDLHTKAFKFDQADSSGLIRTVEVMVIPKKDEITITMPKSKEREMRESLLEQVKAMISGLYKEKLNRLSAANPTPGEKEIVTKEITGEMEQALKRADKFSNTTLEVLTSNFSVDPSSLRELARVLDTTQYTDQVSLREMSTFYTAVKGEHYHAVKPHLDNMRNCHPMFAREDLSELTGEELEIARKVIALSVEYGDIAFSKEASRPSTKGEFGSELDRARRTIRKHTPYMTPAMVDVVINHPDKLEQVKDTLAERSVPIHEADDLIHEIANTSVPLSDGAL